MAPKTGDPGLLSSLGLASLAASGLAYLGMKKRKKMSKNM
ncbi:LPXTG cell wall anchor domain-containing protein [Urinicoccus massiliensis]|nr:LPXTG cell wall anchor domain-containing protein [Urinicoccus massiliensis]